MATFMVVHGAWGAGWAWKKMRPLMRARGHELFTPTQTGIGERSHLAGPDVDLELHIADNLGVLEYEDLHDVILVGHSYGGMVATGVADRATERIAKLVYLDAFVPRDGQAVIDLIGEPARSNVLARAQSEGENWRVPANPMPPDTGQADLEWAVPRRVAQPQKAFLQPARLGGAVDRLPRTYIYCRRPGPGDMFRPFADRARSEPGWIYHELDASHNPHITMPETLAALFDDIAMRE